LIIITSETNNSSDSKYSELNPLWIAVFIDILGFYIIIPFLPGLMKIYDTTPFIIGLLLAINALFTLISAPLWGKLSDRYGRKPTLLIAQFGTFLAFMTLALSNSLQLIFIARMIDGIFGGNFPIVKAIISDTVPPKDRGLQMTNIGVIHVFAGLIGPGLAGFLSLFQPLGDQYPLAAPGFVAAGLSLATMIITLLFVQESWSKKQRERAEKQIDLKLKLRKNKDASYLLALYTFHAISFTMYITTLAIYIAIKFGLDIIGISILLTISGISRAIVRFTLFKPTHRLLGEKRMMILGLFILVITFFLIGFITNLIEFIILMVLISYGVSCSRGLLISKITQSVSPKEMGKINGYTTTIDSMAQIIGPIIGTLIISTMESYWLGIFLSIIALGAFLMIFKETTPYFIKMQNLKDKK